MTTPEMRHEPALDRAETATEMDADDITFEDLLTEEPGEAAQISSFAQLLAEGFPRTGGLAQLAAIADMADPDHRFTALQQGYLEIFDAQNRALSAHLQAAVGAQSAFPRRPTVEKREAKPSDPKSVG